LLGTGVVLDVGLVVGALGVVPAPALHPHAVDDRVLVVHDGVGLLGSPHDHLDIHRLQAIDLRLLVVAAAALRLREVEQEMDIHISLRLQLDQLVDDARVGERVIGDVDRLLRLVQEGEVIANAVVVRSEDGLDVVLRIDTVVHPVADHDAATEDRDQSQQSEKPQFRAHRKSLSSMAEGRPDTTRCRFLPNSQGKAAGAPLVASNTLGGCYPSHGSWISGAFSSAATTTAWCSRILLRMEMRDSYVPNVRMY